MDKDIISIIVPVYNISEYVEQCVESIIQQTYINLDIILVDDGSTDNSGKLLDKYQTADNRVRVIHKINGGLVSARKVGLQAAYGKYILYVDGDDWIDRNHVGTMYNLISKESADIAAAGYIDEGETVNYKYNNIPDGIYEKDILEKIVYPTALSLGTQHFEFGILPFLWNKIFKREKLKYYQIDVPDDVNVSEDVFCLYPYIWDSEKIVVSSDCTYHYRNRKGTMSHTDESIISLRKRLNQLEQFLSVKAGYKQFIESQVRDYILWNIFCKAQGVLYKGNVGAYPFYRVKKTDTVAIYGAGKRGIKLAEALINDCKIVAVFDKSPKITQIGCIPVMAVNELQKIDFDKIIISMANESQQEIAVHMLHLLGVDDNRIIRKFRYNNEIVSDLDIIKKRLICIANEKGDNGCENNEI